MFDLFDTSDENKFSWDNIIDVKTGRTNLGEDMPVLVYRLFQYTLKDDLSKRFGDEVTVDIFRKAGELAGIEFATHVLDLKSDWNLFIANLQESLEALKIGILRVENIDLETGEAILTVSEDLDCSGLPILGKTVCNYDEGFLAGILKTYTNKNYVVTEIDCWATGSRVCRFKAVIQE